MRGAAVGEAVYTAGMKTLIIYVRDRRSLHSSFAPLPPTQIRGQGQGPKLVFFLEKGKDCWLVLKGFVEELGRWCHWMRRAVYLTEIGLESCRIEKVNNGEKRGIEVWCVNQYKSGLKIVVLRFIPN